MTTKVNLTGELAEVMRMIELDGCGDIQYPDGQMVKAIFDIAMERTLRVSTESSK